MFQLINLARLFSYALAMLPITAHAGVYKCLDQQDKVFYQDRPCQELTSAQLSPALSQSVPDDNKPHFLWKAISEKGTIYLMGALPYGANEMYPLSEVITDALSESDVLVIGADIRALPQAELLPILANRGVYSDNSTLRDHVKAATWEKLLNLSKTSGITEETIALQKPWMASLTLISAAAKQAGYSQELSIDKAFIKDAQMRKPMLQLDSVDELAKVLDSFSEIEQEQILLRTLNELERGNDYFKSMAEAWTNGDFSTVELIVRHSFDSLPSADKLLKRLFSDRNAAMANKIEELTADGRTYFIVLEAAHLVGEHGLLKLLQAKGFKPSQL